MFTKFTRIKSILAAYLSSACEIPVYGDPAEALQGRLRIAVSWSHLPTIKRVTGAAFFSIMCAPGAIEDALMQAAGGSRDSQK